MAKDYRRCISCRQVALKSEFWRVVKCHPTQELAIDLGTRLLQGRSAYICRSEGCRQAAQKKNRLSRALKVAVPDDFYQQLNLLEDRA